MNHKSITSLANRIIFYLIAFNSGCGIHFGRYSWLFPVFCREISLEIDPKVYRMDRQLETKHVGTTGGKFMNVTYEHKPAMTFIGYSTSIRPEEGYQKCPEFWDREYARKYARLWQTMQPETAVTCRRD